MTTTLNIEIMMEESLLFGFLSSSGIISRFLLIKSTSCSILPISGFSCPKPHPHRASVRIHGLLNFSKNELADIDRPYLSSVGPFKIEDSYYTSLSLPYRQLCSV